MKVLLVLNEYLPTEQALWRQVALSGIDLHVAFTLDAPRGATMGPPHFGTQYELKALRARGDRLTWMSYKGLPELVKHLDPDVVHILNEPWSLVVSQVIHAQRRGVVVHGCESRWDQGSVLETMVRRSVVQRNLRHMSGFVSWNNEGISLAQTHGLPTGSPTMVLSAVLPEAARFSHREQQRAECRKDWGLEQEFVTGYVGRLVPEKGIQWLLESWQAAGLSDSARLMFIGLGRLQSLIWEAAEKDQRICLLGSVSPDELPKVMASLDVLVLPSLTTRNWSEQYGRVITEAMASGTAVIASNSGAIPEVVGDAGIIVKEGSTSELAAALRLISDDVPLRRTFVDAGLNRARTIFSPHVQASALIRFWQSVVNSDHHR